MSKLDEVMMNRELSNVSKMLYSYMFKATGDDEVIINLDGFNRMFSSIVTGDEIDKKACFDEMLSAGLLKLHSKEEDETVVYSLVK